MSVQTEALPLQSTSKFRAYFELLKFRLTSLVVFSSVMTYLLASHGDVDYVKLGWLILGGLMVTGSSNTINQIAERELDKLMTRTLSRPLPTGRLSVPEAAIYSVALGIGGLLVMAIFVNVMTALLCLISLMLYGFVYTPMKRLSPIAVLIGAIPGAMPPLIGWVAMTGQITVEGLILFGIQFMWQFPHFWAIAWVLDDDYKRAGFKLLPSGGGRDVRTALQIMIYTLMLIPLGLLPYQFGMTGITSAIIATVSGTLFLMSTFHLMRECSRKAALGIMFGSFLYLPIVQIAFVFDKL
jgi:protoheme IX farnesyltransferase